MNIQNCAYCDDELPLEEILRVTHDDDRVVFVCSECKDDYLSDHDDIDNVRKCHVKN